MARLSNPNLCIAMVANAIAESGLKPGIAGDCGDYANRHPDKSINIEGKGQCCSFGLWQYNICGGMGIGYLEANGNPSDAESKMNILSDYNLQVDYMVGKLQSRYSSDLAQEKSVDEWVDFVYEREDAFAEVCTLIGEEMFAEFMIESGGFSIC